MVNHGRWSFSAIVQAISCFCHQAPHLSAREAPAAGECRLAPHLPLPECVTVALVIVRSDASRVEVPFVIAGELDVGKGALPEQRETGGTAAAEELRLMVLAIAE